MTTIEDIRKFNIFSGFSTEDISTLLPRLVSKTFPANTTIIYRGDPGYSMFMILSGSAAATLINEDGIEYTLSTMNEGDLFGELALLTGEPRTASVKAITDVQAIEITQDLFQELRDRYPELNSAFFRLLATRIGRKDIHEQIKDIESKDAIASLLSVQKPPGSHQIDGDSKWARDINETINGLATGKNNVLIIGERGSGKYLTARLIHFRGKEEAPPLLHLDCNNPPPIQRESQASGSGIKDELHQEIAQEAALFGHGTGIASYAKGIRRGYLELANNGTLILENIECLAPRTQKLLFDYLTKGEFTRRGENLMRTSNVRIISTTEDKRAHGPDTFMPELLTLLSNSVVQLKPLRERKRDIPVIVKSLLNGYNRKFSKNVGGFSKEALNVLVDHDWPLNIDELKQVIERAVAITDGNQITEQQIFLRIPDFAATGKINLTKFSFLGKLVHHRLMPLGLQFVSVPFILGVILYTLWGPEKNNVANLAVWSAWWPFLIFSTIVSARSWGGYCPLPAISNSLNFMRTKYLSVPEFLNRYGVWIGMTGFVFIFTIEHAAHMFTEARATGLLLLAILTCAFITNAIYGKRSWCKHICPLGKVVSHFADLSWVQLGSNNNICSSQCQTNDCVKNKNCPMGIHPSAAMATKACVFCFSCIKKCQHKSARLSACFPWQQIMARGKWEMPATMFNILLLASVLAMKLSDWAPLSQPVLLHLIGFPASGAFLKVAAFSIFFVCLFTLLTIFASGFPVRKNWREYFVRTGPSYLFLAYAGFVNVYLREFVYNGHNLLPWLIESIGLAGFMPPEMVTPNLGTLKALIPLVTLLGAVSSLLMLKAIANKYAFPGLVTQGHNAILLLTSLIFLFIL